MTDINRDLLQWFINCLIRRLQAEQLLLTKVIQSKITNKDLAEELRKSTIKKFKKGKYNHLLETIFGAQIKQICN